MAARAALCLLCAERLGLPPGPLCLRLGLRRLPLRLLRLRCGPALCLGLRRLRRGELRLGPLRLCLGLRHLLRRRGLCRCPSGPQHLELATQPLYLGTARRDLARRRRLGVCPPRQRLCRITLCTLRLIPRLRRGRQRLRRLARRLGRKPLALAGLAHLGCLIRRVLRGTPRRLRLRQHTLSVGLRALGVGLRLRLIDAPRGQGRLRLRLGGLCSRALPRRLCQRRVGLLARLPRLLRQPRLLLRRTLTLLGPLGLCRQRRSLLFAQPALHLRYPRVALLGARAGLLTGPLRIAPRRRCSLLGLLPLRLCLRCIAPRLLQQPAVLLRLGLRPLALLLRRLFGLRPLRLHRPLRVQRRLELCQPRPVGIPRRDRVAQHRLLVSQRHHLRVAPLEVGCQLRQRLVGLPLRGRVLRRLRLLRRHQPLTLRRNLRPRPVHRTELLLAPLHLALQRLHLRPKRRQLSRQRVPFSPCARERLTLLPQLGDRLVAPLQLLHQARRGLLAAPLRLRRLLHQRIARLGLLAELRIAVRQLILQRAQPRHRRLVLFRTHHQRVPLALEPRTRRLQVGDLQIPRRQLCRQPVALLRELRRPLLVAVRLRPLLLLQLCLLRPNRLLLPRQLVVPALQRGCRRLELTVTRGQLRSLFL